MVLWRFVFCLHFGICLVKRGNDSLNEYGIYYYGDRERELGRETIVTGAGEGVMITLNE